MIACFRRGTDSSTRPAWSRFHIRAAVVPADVIDGSAEGVEGKHREGGEHRQHDAAACLPGASRPDSL